MLINFKVTLQLDNHGGLWQFNYYLPCTNSASVETTTINTYTMTLATAWVKLWVPGYCATSAAAVIAGCAQYDITRMMLLPLTITITQISIADVVMQGGTEQRVAGLYCYLGCCSH